MRWQLQLHNDAKQFGVEVLSAEDVEAYAQSRPVRGLAELAEAIDSYWPERIEAFRPHPNSGPKHILTFRGFYTAIFRKASWFVHAAPGSLKRHVQELPTQYIVRQEMPGKWDVPALGVAMVGFMLLVYSHHFGWPPDQRVRQITDALLKPEDEP